MPKKKLPRGNCAQCGTVLDRLNEQYSTVRRQIARQLERLP